MISLRQIKPYKMSAIAFKDMIVTLISYIIVINLSQNCVIKYAFGHVLLNTQKENLLNFCFMNNSTCKD